MDYGEHLTANTSAAVGPLMTDSGTPPDWVGYISCFIAIIFFGSNFVPVKKFETGDGTTYDLNQLS